jgi:hypothetical protein
MSVTFNPFTGNLDFNDTTKASGSDTQIQFNDGGKLSGDSGLVFNKTTDALTIAGPVIHPLGAAATPSLTFTGDPNTGLYSPGADQLALSTGGTGRLFVDASGNVGIGAAPNAAFALDATAGNGAIRAKAGGFYVSETYSATNNIYRIYDNSGEFAIESQVFGNTTTNSSPIVFRTSNSGGRNERMRITADGRLGLGTSSPSSLLHLADAGNITVGTTTGTKIGTATTQKLAFYNATPVVQPTAVADATDAATAISQLNALLAHMRTLGLIAT